jgi:hypothetical protein
MIWQKEVSKKEHTLIDVVFLLFLFLLGSPLHLLLIVFISFINVLHLDVSEGRVNVRLILGLQNRCARSVSILIESRPLTTYLNLAPADLVCLLPEASVEHVVEVQVFGWSGKSKGPGSGLAWIASERDWNGKGEEPISIE